MIESGGWKLSEMESEPAKRVRVRRSREEIAELIASYRQSGQRQREFCQQRGIGLSTLQNYLRRERTKGQQKQRRLLEVEVVAKRSRVAETPQLELIALVGRLWATDQGRVRMSSEEPRKKAKKKLVTNTGSLLVMACV
jgi:lambda repressor-like predicted transcriptional regulator